MDRRTVLTSGLAATAVAAIAIKPLCARGAEPRSLLDFIPREHHAAIRAGTSQFDCAPALQRAVDTTAGAGATLVVPAGTYVLTPATPIDDEDRGSVCLAAVLMRSGMVVHGEPGSILRIRGGISSDRAPRSMGMFCTDRPIANIALVGLTLDMNGRENPISPERARRRYSRANQSHILVTGTTGGVAARIDNALVERCTFLDTPGVCCIVMAQSNAPGVQLGRGWRLIDNEFRDNGVDTDDHSSVYAWAEDVEATGNRFINTRFVGTEQRLAGLVGYEVHGANHLLKDNVFSGYYRGIWVAPNRSAPVVGTRIVSNRFERGGVGVDFFGDQPGLPPISGSVIEDNTFVFADDPGLGKPDLKACVQIASKAAQRDITIARNRASSTSGRVATALAVVTGGGLEGRVHDAITIVDNETDGLTFGTVIRTAPDVGLGTIVSQRNRWTNLTPAGVFGIAVGDAVDHTGRLQTIGALTLGGGSASGAAGGERAYGVRVNALVGRLDVAPVSGRTLSKVYWEDVGAVIQQRSGLAARR